MTEQQIFEEAQRQLEAIDRYFSKNWMDEDFPTDAVWACLSLPEQKE